MSNCWSLYFLCSCAVARGTVCAVRTGRGESAAPSAGAGGFPSNGRWEKKKKTLKRALPLYTGFFPFQQPACKPPNTYTHSCSYGRKAWFDFLFLVLLKLFIIFEGKMQSRNWHDQNQAIWDIHLSPLNRGSEICYNYFWIKGNIKGNN